MPPVPLTEPRVSDDVAAALADRTPVVALESTLLTHGLPRPDNEDIAARIEDTVRRAGAVPATIAVLDGVVQVGLTADQRQRLCRSENPVKLSSRDLGFAMALGLTGGTTVAATAVLAYRAGIEVFATGGLGGVHRGADETFDISADLDVLATTPIVVVSAGVKSILDVAATLERLETLAVPVLSYRSEAFAGFYLSDSGCPSPWRLDTPEQIADVVRARRLLGTDRAGLLVANPLPPDRQVEPSFHDRLLADGTARLRELGIRGKDVTPHLLDYVHRNSAGETLRANVELILANADLAARIAAALREVRR